MSGAGGLRNKIRGQMFKLPLMLTCRQVEDFLLDYVEGTLPRGQRLIFDLHLALCREGRLPAWRRPGSRRGAGRPGPGHSRGPRPAGPGLRPADTRFAGPLRGGPVKLGGVGGKAWQSQTYRHSRCEVDVPRTRRLSMLRWSFSCPLRAGSSRAAH